MKRFYKQQKQNKKTQSNKSEPSIRISKHIYSYTSKWLSKAKETVGSNNDRFNSDSKETDFSSQTKISTTALQEELSDTQPTKDNGSTSFYSSAASSAIEKIQNTELLRKPFSFSFKDYEKYFQGITDKLNWDINQDVIKEMISLKDFGKAKQTFTKISEAISLENFDVQKLLKFKNLELPYEQLLDHGLEVSDPYFLDQAYCCSKLSRISYDDSENPVYEEILQNYSDFEIVESELEKDSNLKWLAIRKCRHHDSNRHLSDLYIAFRGTKQLNDILTDISLMPKHIDENIAFHNGILTQIRNEYDRLSQFLEMNVDQHNVTSIALTGHSLGGGYAKVLYALLMLENHSLKQQATTAEDSIAIERKNRILNQTSVYTFGAPLTLFARDSIPDYLEERGDNIHCFVNNTDIIPRVLGNDFYHDFYSIGNQLSDNLDQIDLNKITQSITTSLDHVTSKAKELPTMMSRVNIYSVANVRSQAKEEESSTRSKIVAEEEQKMEPPNEHLSKTRISHEKDFREQDDSTTWVSMGDSDSNVNKAQNEFNVENSDSQYFNQDKEKSNEKANVQELSVKSHLFRPWGTFYLLHPNKSYPISITESEHKRMLITPYPHLWLGLNLWYQEHSSRTYTDRLFTAFSMSNK